ncbi:hypothetical protein EG327_008917 [Venturia inaequalis]|uniref:Uncharacterized protein n=1 Tax=Venturia inaequalis TaxID=5025 RepID=A0A8H3YU83_VENIN|nr:hypothetical protein EG327_008917 [Venturia inaequalis]
MTPTNQVDHDDRDGHQAKLPPTSSDDAPPSYDDAIWTAQNEQCRYCNVEIFRNAIRSQRRMVLDYMCQDCALAPALQIPKCTACDWTIDTNDGFRTGICSRCATRVGPSHTHALQQRFYYCGICYEEMHPPTPTSRHAYDRRCHECHVVLGINGFVTIIPTLQDAWVAMLFVEEGAMPFVEEGAMPFVEEGAMPFVEEGAMPFVEEGAMPFEEEEKKETYHLGLGKLPKTPTFRAILQRIREFLPWGLGQSHRYEELSEDVESCLPLPVPRGLGQGCVREELAVESENLLPRRYSMDRSHMIY